MEGGRDRRRGVFIRLLESMDWCGRGRRSLRLWRMENVRERLQSSDTTELDSCVLYCDLSWDGADGLWQFHSDAWALLESQDGFEWLKLEPSKDSVGVPEARGWFPSSFWEGNKVVMQVSRLCGSVEGKLTFLQGGLNERNERLGDGWVLEIVAE